MIELLGIFAVPLLIANVAAFIHFKFTDALEEVLSKGGSLSSLLNGTPSPEIIYLTLGIAGAMLALIMHGNRKVDKGYKIVIPTAFVIEIGTLIYLLLFDAGVVK